jgi:hypothetical protein
LYLKVFGKCAEEIHVLLKYDQNDGYFTWRPVHIYRVIKKSLCTWLQIITIITNNV